MSIRRFASLWCDACGAWVDCDGVMPKNRARKWFRAVGWTRRRRVDSPGLVDLCPTCTKLLGKAKNEGGAA